jgi:hypothetical protein
LWQELGVAVPSTHSLQLAHNLCQNNDSERKTVEGHVEHALAVGQLRGLSLRSFCCSKNLVIHGLHYAGGMTFGKMCVAGKLSYPMIQSIICVMLFERINIF